MFSAFPLSMPVVLPDPYDGLPPSKCFYGLAMILIFELDEDADPPLLIISDAPLCKVDRPIPLASLFMGLPP